LLFDLTEFEFLARSQLKRRRLRQSRKRIRSCQEYCWAASGAALVR
jgi:hypothetical protein